MVHLFAKEFQPPSPAALPSFQFKAVARLHEVSSIVLVENTNKKDKKNNINNSNNNKNNNDNKKDHHRNHNSSWLLILTLCPHAPHLRIWPSIMSVSKRSSASCLSASPRLLARSARVV